MRKRLLSIVLVLCLLIGLCPALAVPTFAADADTDFVIEGTILKGYNGRGGSVTIPDSVTTIHPSAFGRNTALTSVTIPDSVTMIMSESFRGCTALTEVVLPKGLTTVPYMCFEGCTSLRTVVFQEGLTTLGDQCFSGCTSLKTVALPKGITTLGQNCFRNCTGLTEVTLPEGITAMQAGCFEGCTGLKSVKLPDSLTALGQLCFMNCTGLTEVTLPKQLTALGQWCFLGCASLKAVDLPDGVTEIGNSCFSGCASLKTMVLPKGISEISSSCFWGCTSLESVVLPDGLKTIGGDCFRKCSNLTGIRIPDTVTELGIRAFAEAKQLTSVVLPDSLKTIGEDCFQQSGVTELTIPAGVTKMGRLAEYQYINSIKTITFKGKDLSGLSASIYPNVTVYVQPGTNIPDCLKDNIVYTTDEGAVQYRLDIIDKLDLDFAITNGRVASKSISIKNTGTKALSGLKIQTTNQNLQVSLWQDATSIEPNRSSYLIFSPNTGLTSGKYTATVTITADGGYKLTLNVSFTVTAQTCISVTPSSLDFGTVVTGYAQPAAKTITIKNTGDHEVELTASSEPKNYTYTVGTTKLAKGQSTSVTIQPKAGLAVGEYTEKISFKCKSHSNSFAVDLKFTVKGEPKLASDPAEMDFGKAKQGYTPEEMTVTLKNTGTASFVLKTATLSSPTFEFRLKLYEGGYGRDPGETADLKVRPVSGLGNGTYTGTLDIDTDVGVKLSVPLKFVVEGESSISINPYRLDFGTVGENYTQPAAKTVTIKNTGKSSVTLQTPASTNYVLGTFSRTTLAAGEEATFTIQPKAGLKTGVYTEWIIVKTDQNDSDSIGIDFQVGKKGSSFVDVKESDWFFKDVEYVYEKGLMNGVGDNRFNPNGTTTRGQIVTILYRLDGEPGVSGNSGFADVGSGQYYAKAVKWASDHQIVNGYSSVKFGPDDPITREQMAAILYRYASYKGYDVSARADLSKYTDAGLIGGYALDAISWANSQGLINGVTDTTIKPQGSAIRAQAAAILHRFYENIVK